MSRKPVIIQAGNPTTIIPQPYELRSKELLIRDIGTHNFLRSLSMLDCVGLPDSIPQQELKKIVYVHGKAFIVKAKDGDIYACFGNYTTEPGPYYNFTSTPKHPTKCHVVNPYLDLDGEFTIGVDCAVIKNDSMEVGLMPLINRYATLSAENEITLYIADIASRMLSLIVSGDDDDAKAAKIYLEELEKGKLGTVISKAFSQGITTQPYGNSAGGITQLIEYCQYLDASFDRRIGINGNYNMKRESIVASEADLNTEGLMPYPSDVLFNWQAGFQQMNKIFGTNASVDFGENWKQREEENGREKEEKGEGEENDAD